MIDLDIDIDWSDLDADAKKFNRMEIEVGVLNKSATARVADRDAGLKTLPGTGKQASKIKRGGAGKSELRLTELAKILDNRYGVFSESEKHFTNQDVVRVTNQLVDVFEKGAMTETMQRRIENACIALVRNPIMRKDFGANASSTIGGGIGYNGYKVEGKGFDWPMVDTGFFFQNIKARMKNV